MSNISIASVHAMHQMCFYHRVLLRKTPYVTNVFWYSDVENSGQNLSAGSTHTLEQNQNPSMRSVWCHYTVDGLPWHPIEEFQPHLFKTINQGSCMFSSECGDCDATGSTFCLHTLLYTHYTHTVHTVHTHTHCRLSCTVTTYRIHIRGEKRRAWIRCRQSRPLAQYGLVPLYGRLEI